MIVLDNYEEVGALGLVVVVENCTSCRVLMFYCTNIIPFSMADVTRTNA